MVDRISWQPIETAPRDPATSIQMGYWNRAVDRWEWLTHGAWDDKSKGWSDGDPIAPTHWRPIGRPA